MPKFSTQMIPSVICFLAFALFASLISFKYFHLSYYDWDLAFFTQAMWNLCHGSQYTSLVGINYFGDHSYYFTFLLLPLFAIFPHPLTLVFLKIAAFIGSAYFLYRIVRRQQPQWLALSFMGLYLVFPANVFAIIYEFNIEAFAPVFLLLVFDYFHRQKYEKFIVACLLLGLIKENMLLVVFVFGLCGLFVRKDRWKWGVLPLAVSGVAFLGLVFWLIPMHRHLHQHAFWVRYVHILDHPVGFLSKLIFGNVQYISDLFGPLLVPAVFDPGALLFAVPILGQHLMSNEFAEHTIYYHYGPTMTPFIFLAASAGIVKLRQKFNLKVFVIFLVCLLGFSAFHVVRFIPSMKARLTVYEDNQDALRWAMIKKIPADAGVVASFCFLAPLATRQNLYSFHKIYDEFYQDPAKINRAELYEGSIFKLPEDARYALIDLNDFFFKRAQKQRPELTNQKFNEFMQDWNVIEKQGPIVLLQRRAQR
ncbi:MAG: DUF2079 domain-containing protein [Candidatus Omnitrophica bacterium]|nr:DUF2079 domain-containing protein [Candidatus Omnitrophota bacterium]